MKLQGRSKSLTSIDSLSPHSASNIEPPEGSPRGPGSSRGHGGRAGSVSVHATKSSSGMERGARSEDLLGHAGHGETNRDHLSIPMVRAGSEGGVMRTVSHGSNSSLQRRRKLSTASKVDLYTYVCTISIISYRLYNAIITKTHFPFNT